MSVKRTSFLLFVLICLLINVPLQGQCEGNVYYPDNPQTAPTNLNSIIIATNSYAGDYYVITNAVVGESYTFATTAATADMITLRNISNNTVLAYGLSPLTVKNDFDVSFEVHITLANCDVQASIRTSTVKHEGFISPKVGVNKTTPEATLDVDGEIKLSEVKNNPTSGMIQYNTSSNDFEGYTGADWQSLTQSNQSSLYPDNVVPIRYYARLTAPETTESIVLRDMDEVAISIGANQKVYITKFNIRTYTYFAGRSGVHLYKNTLTYDGRSIYNGYPEVANRTVQEMGDGNMPLLQLKQGDVLYVAKDATNTMDVVIWGYGYLITED